MLPLRKQTFLDKMEKRRLMMLLFSLLALQIIGLGQKPNIIFILADDLGWNNLSCYGNSYVKTPHLDQLAEEGARFTQAYVSPQCTPTRASLLSGLHTARVKMWHVIPKYSFPNAFMQEPEYSEMLSKDQNTLGDVMRSTGYTTAFFGKWHLTNYDTGIGYYTRLNAEHADDYGFDEVEPMTDPKEYQHFTDKGVDFLTDTSIDFIRRNKEKPFFLYLSHHTIHGKVLAPDSLAKKFTHLGFPDKGPHNATYLAALEHLDQSIGRLRSTLEKEGILDNTLLLFLSDNGGVDAEFDNTPLKAGKGSLYEGGIRVPLIMRYPKEIPAGLVIETPVQAADFLPTLADFAQNKARYETDGFSLKPLFKSQTLPERALITYAPLYDPQWGATPGAVIRKGPYKFLLHFGDYIDLEKDKTYVTQPKEELYHIPNDISERHNLLEKEPMIAKELKRELLNWIEEMQLEIPLKNPNYDQNRALLRE